MSSKLLFAIKFGVDTVQGIGRSLKARLVKLRVRRRQALVGTTSLFDAELPWSGKLA